MTTSVYAEERLALAIEAAGLGCWTWDMAAGTTTWDTRLEELHGLPPGGFGGTFADWVAALHPDDRAACIARVEQALEDPGPYVLVHRTTWPDGSLHTIECRGMVLVDDSGRPTGTTGFAMDVTPREQLVQTLQRVLLPQKLPTVPRISVAARYEAAGTTANIGGDWYAVVGLPDGRMGLAIGDVAGHGLDAVANMAATRFSIRALALTEQRPDVVLGRLSEVVRVFQGNAMITALYGILDPDAWTWTYASAGHMPVIVRSPRGTRLLDDPVDPPLGVADSFRTRCVDLDVDSTLLLYTDGLIERRDHHIQCDLERLVEVCRLAPTEPKGLCDYVIDSLLGDDGNDDDIAVLAASIS